MKLPRLSRRWWIASSVVVGLSLLLAVALLVVYPRLGAKMIRDKLSNRIAAKLGREVRFGAIDVSLGHAVIHDVEVRGPNDGMTPLVHIDTVEIDFGVLASFAGNMELGAAKLDGVLVTLRRDAEGKDNISDVIERLRTDRAKKAAAGRKSTMPTSLSLTRGKLLADDAVTGTTAIIGDGVATWKPGELVAQARNVTATTIAAPRASAQKIDIKKLEGAPPSVAFEGGELAIWPKLALSGIAGSVIANPERANHYVIDLAGGYGGVPGNLWTAKGGLDTQQLTGSIDLEAAKFQLDRLAPILEKSPVVDYKGTSVDTKLHLDLDRDGGRFAGEMHLTGLNVGHPMIAEKEVHDLDLTANIDGHFSRAMRRLDLTRGDFVARGIPFSVTGSVGRPVEMMNEVLSIFGLDDPTIAASGPKRHPETGELIPLHGPAGIQFVKLRLVIPPIDCQRVLNAIPEEMAPYMMGYRMRGVFDTDVNLDIDWADLDATKLGGHVGIKHCKVVDQPADSPKRLKDEFEHYVEVEKGQWMSFVVGPTNEDFVPLEDVSPFLIKSIMTTEDAGFYKHRGFITSEFRTALVNNLKAGKFKFGASSITMQFVKNVLLYREKTLARKLQELFLTWHVENTLEKDRILEIYFNVIEYGPALYGIGPASRHFFGKPAKDLNAVEAAFFSSILPSPKERYKQYCANTLTKWTDAKIKRILALMLKRERITQAEYDQASGTPLLFVKDGDETEDDCLKRVKKAIKNARSTNPLKR